MARALVGELADSRVLEGRGRPEDEGDGLGDPEAGDQAVEEGGEDDGRGMGVGDRGEALLTAAAPSLTPATTRGTSGSALKVSIRSMAR